MEWRLDSFRRIGGFFVLFWLETSHSFRKLQTHNPWIDYDRFLFQNAHRYVGVYTSNPD